jgi:multiple sugar transport system permease protein
MSMTNPSGLSRSRTLKDLTPSSLLRLALLLVIAIFFGVPILWLILAPSKIDVQLIDLAPLSFGSFENYARSWRLLLNYNNAIVLKWLNNSVIYTLAAVVLSIVIVVPAGYAFAIARFTGRKALMTLTLITMILPGSAMVLPLFLEMNWVGLVDTQMGVILPALFYPFGVYLSYVHFATGIPKDLLSAGRVDGCNEWQLFWHIGLPLAKTLFALLAFLSFGANWNNYFFAFVMLNNPDLYNLPVGLQAMASGTPMLNPTFAATDSSLKRPEAATAILLMVLPVIAIFLVAQRYVVSSVLSGATKE